MWRGFWSYAELGKTFISPFVISRSRVRVTSLAPIKPHPFGCGFIALIRDKEDKIYSLYNNLGENKKQGVFS